MTNKILIILLTICACAQAQTDRARDYGIEIGILKLGELNAITDVPGVQVGIILWLKEIVFEQV